MSHDESIARARLVAVLRSPTDAMVRGLEQRKAEAAQLVARNDMLWYLLLQSMATLQSSAGHIHIFPSSHKEPLPSIMYDALLSLHNSRRETVLVDAFKKVRFGQMKAVWLANNLQRIERMGGLRQATSAMRELPDMRAKIKWMRQFDGIGEKYARNVWMDIRDPAFVDSIAVDSRLMSVGRILGMDSHVYKDQETFFLEMASDAGISGWEADRLIYNFREELLAEAGIEIPWKAKRAKRAFRSACSG